MEEKKLGKIGGTTVSAIVGQNPWDNAHGAYLKLRREVPPTPDNPAMARGRLMEPVVANLFAGGHPEFRVAYNRKGTESPEIYVHEDFDYLVGHPDRLLYDASTDVLKQGLEIKTSNWSNMKNWGHEDTDEIPVHYLIQCQWYAGLAKLPEWRVAVAFFDDRSRLQKYKEYTIHADKELFDALVARAVEFYETHVIPGIPPEIEEVDETTKQWIVQRFPRNIEPIAPATFDEEKLMQEFIASKQALDEAQKVHEKVENALKLAIGDRAGIESPLYGKITWKTTKSSQRVDYRAICAQLSPSEELITQFTKTVPGSRRFLANLKIKDED